MKNVFLLLLCLVFVASIVEAKIVRDSLYEIPKTTVAPVIDGKQDAVWKTVDWNMQRLYTVDGTGADSGLGLTGMSKAMWDATNLYILFYTIDDVICDIPANANWNQDAIEIYIDGDNSKIPNGVTPDPGNGLAPTDYQFTIPHFLKDQEVGHYYISFGTVIDTTGIEYKLADVPDTVGFPGWMTEIKIPLAALSIDGGSAANTLIGWELQQDESDNGTARQFMSKWWNGTNNSWTDASIWGTAKLSSRLVDTVFAISKLPTGVTPTVDGTMDAVYQRANPVSMNLFKVGDPPGADTVNTDPLFGGFITAYPVYNDNTFYMFCDVVDAILTPIPTNANWNQDAIEIYFDGDNSKTPNGVSPDPGNGLAPADFQFTIPYLYKGVEVGHLYSCFGTVIDTTGIEYKIVDRDARDNTGSLPVEGSGYNIEVKIPLAALSIDGTAAGALLGFELQLDNSSSATIGRGGMEKWWNASNNSWTDASIWGTAKLGGVVDGVIGRTPSIARGYRLDQNYPNPFNPSTYITFELPKSEKVRLAVYNLLGEQVAVLVNGVMSGTSHTVTFDAKNLASGIYFYKLEAGNTVLAKKMILLK